MLVRVKNLFALSLALLLVQALGHAQEPPQSEYRIKAGFIYNFAKFIDWPPTAFTNEASPLIIAVLGENRFDGDLEQMVRGKQINSRAIIIKPIRDVADAKNCHVLFISASEKSRLAEICKQLHDSPVLTVGETDRFIEAGGMINLVREANKIRFQINDEAAKAAGLKISSKLLGLAIPAKAAASK